MSKEDRTQQREVRAGGKRGGREREAVDGQWLTFPFPFVHHQPLH